MKLKALATLLLLTTVCLLSSGTLKAQSPVPRFEDYSAGEIYKGPAAPLVLKHDDLTFKTRLRWAAKNQKPTSPGITY